MIRPNYLRDWLSPRWPGSLVLCFGAILSCTAATAQNQPVAMGPWVEGPSTPVPVAAAPASPVADAAKTPAPATKVPAAPPAPSKHDLREAENAYLTGAKKLERDDLNAAESDFLRALRLDPENRNYAIAISVTRQHRLTELVQQAAKARQTGDPEKAKTLLAEARAIDPTNPIVGEHDQFNIVSSALPQQSAGTDSPLADLSRMISNIEVREPWKIQAPVLTGAVHLAPSDEVKSFSLRGTAPDVVRNVASAYGIRAIIDETVEQKILRFNLENVTYQQAISAVMTMANVFAVSLDETSILVARDDQPNRDRLQRQLQETIELPGYTIEQINELANVIRTIFDVKQATVQSTLGSIVVRAPEEVLGPMNRTIQGLMESSGEVLVEVKVYEITTTGATKIGATLPGQFTAFNVSQAANALVNANPTLVQQAIAQGLIPANASNLQIALALVYSGLVQSTLASNLVGVFGGGTTQTGISASTQTTLNLGLNSSDIRALDDVQIRVGDRQAAVFREGTRYPITSSTYSTGLTSAATSALKNVSVNGVSVANLLSQFAGGTGATIPQITYEDLGVTLKATPVIQKSGRVSLALDLKIEALAGGSANGIPVLASRQFSSNITLASGESALMVSSVSKTETAALTGLPGLSELPGFQMPTQKDAERDSSQLVVVVTPHVVRRRSDLLAGPRLAVPN